MFSYSLTNIYNALLTPTCPELFLFLNQSLQWCSQLHHTDHRWVMMFVLHHQNNIYCKYKNITAIYGNHFGWELLSTFICLQFMAHFHCWISAIHSCPMYFTSKVKHINLAESRFRPRLLHLHNIVCYKSR